MRQTTSSGISPQQKNLILRWVNSVETGSPDGVYGNVTRYKDGLQGRVYQYTLGRSQTTEAGDNVGELIRLYMQADSEGKYDAGLGLYFKYPPYGLAAEPKAVRKPFEDAFRASGDDSDMRAVQDKFFEEKYFIPAYNWWKTNGFKDALSLLVVFDSFIHSGSILSFLRKRFPATTDNEREWVTQYVTARHEWLKNHSIPLLRKTVYRTKSLMGEIKDGNWELKPPLFVNGIRVE